jgi:hypothetical protein
MITIQHILDEKQIQNVKKIMDDEIKTALCTTVPLYQSYNNMHFKYKDNELISSLFNRMLKEAEKSINESLKIFGSWFNICKEDSIFDYHSHKNTILTCVYFLENCEGNGTIFNIYNSYLQLLCKDNSMIIFDPTISHTIPPWRGKNRYTIAMDFVK